MSCGPVFCERCGMEVEQEGWKLNGVALREWEPGCKARWVHVKPNDCVGSESPVFGRKP